MKNAHLLALLLVSACSSPLLAHPEDRSTTPQETNDKDDIGQAVLSHFAHIVNHFFSILTDPKNPETVAPHVGAIVEELVLIGVEATKRSDPNLEQIKKDLTLMILAKAHSQTLS